ncbi:hypothetical protein NPIL_667021 [Nephila pilipes]|uniref:Uncharacterized protein n=1 Tax=Nephila pilipes TaxID=299642 RepID=A0A8X6TY17_NEPPI|nr:hypothetical protein NPIL_667021 [Nephila pilipes]
MISDTSLSSFKRNPSTLKSTTFNACNAKWAKVIGSKKNRLPGEMKREASKLHKLTVSEINYSTGREGVIHKNIHYRSLDEGHVTHDSRKTEECKLKVEKK